MRRTLLNSFIVSAFFAFCVISCGPSEIPGGEITLKNDIQDKDYNIIEVDQVRTEGGGGGYSVRLKPGQTARVPLKNVRSLRWIRRYKDHANVYLVECPPGFNKKITMKLIDVHSNRISGGCKLVRTGQMVSGNYVKWEK